MSQSPEWEPEPNALYQCLNCDSIFAVPEPVIMFEETIWRCPECYELDFVALPTQAVWSLFWHTIYPTWDDQERFALRMKAEQELGPFNPISRDL